MSRKYFIIIKFCDFLFFILLLFYSLIIFQKLKKKKLTAYSISPPIIDYRVDFNVTYNKKYNIIMLFQLPTYFISHLYEKISLFPMISLLWHLRNSGCKDEKRKWGVPRVNDANQSIFTWYQNKHWERMYMLARCL